MKENRKYIRLQAPIGIIYTLIKKHKKPRATRSLVKDISGGGLRIMAKEELRSGELLEMEIQIPHLHDPICAIGEVVWFFYWKEKDRETREAGVRFRDIEPKDLHRILEYVHTIGIG